MEDVQLNKMLAAGIVTDMQLDQRAHGRFMQMMDRAFLSNYLEGTDSTAGHFAELTTGSHVPTPQPYVAPNFVKPA